MDNSEQELADKAYQHTVLIVDDEPQVGKSIARLLRGAGIGSVLAASGEEGIECIKGAEPPFSLILSDQRMAKMPGTRFLEKARKLTPDSTRYLITGYSDINAIAEAVNKGAIHRYIEKPWDNDTLLEAIEKGLARHELILENERLLKLAKRQNSKLYALNIQLKESGIKHKATLAQLDETIKKLNRKVNNLTGQKGPEHRVKALLDQNQVFSPEMSRKLYPALLFELYEQLSRVADENGFDMPGVS
ncbi:MAG: response regulator [Desulfobacteraceae bacterium]|nr:MAG: response regulator [Desulfobacteraceae bacterium]